MQPGLGQAGQAAWGEERAGDLGLGEVQHLEW